MASPTRPPPNLKLALPILMGAADEDSDDLREIWARLLAATMNPEKREMVRQDFAEAVNKLNPIDATVLNYFALNNGTFANNKRTETANAVGISGDSFLVAVEKLCASGFHERV